MSVLVASTSFLTSELGVFVQSAIQTSGDGCRVEEVKDGTCLPSSTSTSCGESPAFCARQMVLGAGGIGGGCCCLAAEGWVGGGYAPHFAVAAELRHPQLLATPTTTTNAESDGGETLWRSGVFFAFCRAELPASPTTSKSTTSSANTSFALVLDSELPSHLENLEARVPAWRTFRPICVILDERVAARSLLPTSLAAVARCSVRLCADTVRCKDSGQAAAFVQHCRQAMFDSIKRSMASMFKTRPHVTFKADSSLTVAEQTWMCQLTQVGQVGDEVARVIASQWKSPAALSASFDADRIGTAKQIEELTVPTGRGNSRRVGPATARKLLRLFTVGADQADEALRVEE